MYKGSRNNVIIVCPIHGDFIIKAGGHQGGKGCQACARAATSKRMSEPEEYFISRAREVHGDTYSYDNLQYVNLEYKVNITCHEHGDFLTCGRGHLQGKGCPVCAKIRAGNTLDNFLTRSSDAHGDYYDYRLVEYKGLANKVEIICPKHGIFWQHPHTHYAGKGCPDCGVRGYKTSKRGCFYLFSDTENDMVKVGITNNKVSRRLAQINSSGKNLKVVAEFWFDDGKIALGLETKFLRTLREKYEQPSEKFDGYTECFYGVDVTRLLTEIQLSGGGNVADNDPQ